LSKPDQESRGFFIVLSAASGTGKTSIRSIFLERCPGVQFSVSYTTRAPRPGEVDGQDYFFISVAEFRERIDRQVIEIKSELAKLREQVQNIE